MGGSSFAIACCAAGMPSYRTVFKPLSWWPWWRVRRRLLCATAVDQLHDGRRTNYDRELFAQGVGNTVCGLLGVLPMTGVIVRSSANIQAGGNSRLSAILHGFWLLIFVVVLGFLLRQIPTACLAAILVYTGFKLVDFKAFRQLAKYGKSEVVIYAATVTMIVVTDLLTGVLVGIGLAALKLLYTFSHLEAKLTEDEQGTLSRVEPLRRCDIHSSANQSHHNWNVFLAARNCMLIFNILITSITLASNCS